VSNAQARLNEPVLAKLAGGTDCPHSDYLHGAECALRTKAATWLPHVCLYWRQQGQRRTPVLVCDSYRGKTP
jgi:hypothetical protein